MLHRVKGRLRFTAASGMANWLYNELVVRYGQAVHINPGLDNAEPKMNEVLVDGDHRINVIDLPLVTEEQANSAYGHMEWVFLYFMTTPQADERLFIEYVLCGHAEAPSQPCSIVKRDQRLGSEIE